MSEVLGTGAAAPAVTPSTTTVPVVPAPGAPAGQENATPNAENPESKQPRMYTEEEHRKDIQARLARDRRRIERETRLRVENEYLRRQGESGTTSTRETTPQAKGEPKPEDYNGNYEAYIRALTKYDREQEREQQRQQDTKSRGDEQRQAREREIASQVHTKLMVPGAKKYEDFEDVANGDYPVTEPMTAMILDSKIGVDIWYHLGTHPDDAFRIAELSPAGQVRELLKIEATLSAAPAPTQAPAPIKPANTNATVGKDWKDMSTEEHVKAYRDRKRKKT